MSCSIFRSIPSDGTKYGEQENNETFSDSVSGYTVIKDSFPCTRELLAPMGGSRVPKILLEDWTDKSYFEHYGYYLEDKVGTGIHRIIENHPPCLKINGQALSDGANIFDYPKTREDVPVDYELVFTDNRRSEYRRKRVKFENVGPCLIKYEWMRLREYENTEFPVKLCPLQEQTFFVDSRPGVLVPGEMRDFVIGFKSNYDGVYKEDWELRTFPRVHTSKIVFKFRALTSENKSVVPWNVYNSHLDTMEAEHFAKEFLDNILRKVFENLPPLKEQDPINLNSEDEVFLHINRDLYSYNQGVVSYLKEFYLTMFSDIWCLNMLDLEEKVLKSDWFGRTDILNRYRTNKLQLIKSDRNLMHRDYYKKYNEIYEILSYTFVDIQASIEKTRQKYGFKPLPPFVQADSLAYFYFPEIGKDDSKKDLSKKPPTVTTTTDKASDRGKGVRKKRDFIELVPKPLNVIRPTTWAPDNQDYASEVYALVYNHLCNAVQEMDEMLTRHKVSGAEMLEREAVEALKINV